MRVEDNEWDVYMWRQKKSKTKTIRSGQEIGDKIIFYKRNDSLPKFLKI